jgi:hypothetical protein
MDTQRFWKLIKSSRGGFKPDRVNGNMELQRDEFQRLLSMLPPAEIIDFQKHFNARMNEAYHWDLWGAAYIIGGGCSDDSFADFRSWLISMGRQVFEEALSNPESLLKVVDSPGIEDAFFEEFQYVPSRTYEALTGSELPPIPGPSRKNPAGKSWREEDLEHRLPKLWARYDD